MKTIAYIFACFLVAFTTATASAKHATTPNTIPPTAYFNLAALIEEDALLEANTELFGITFSANFLKNMIEEHASKQDNAYILDDTTQVVIPANFLQSMIEDNAARSK